MCKVRRRLFSIASAVSFVLCIATVVLWVRSYPFGGTVYYYASADWVRWSIGSYRGGVVVGRARGIPVSWPRTGSLPGTYYVPGAGDDRWSAFGFEFGRVRR